MANDDSISDDVFEESNKNRNILTIEEIEKRNASPTGYPGFKPSKEALRMYAMENDYFTEPSEKELNHMKRNDEENFDGWQSYKIEDEENAFDENIVHKVCVKLFVNMCRESWGIFNYLI